MKHSKPQRPARQGILPGRLPGRFLFTAGAAFVALSVAGAAVRGDTVPGAASVAEPAVPPAASFVAAGIVPPAAGVVPAAAGVVPPMAGVVPPMAGAAPAETTGPRAEARQDRRRARQDRDGDRRTRNRARRAERRGDRGRRSSGRFDRGRFDRERFDGRRALLSSRVAERLEVTEAQREELRTLLRALADERRDGRRALADARRELARALRDDDRPADEVRALGEAAGRLQAEEGLRRRTERERVAAVLTEEQRARWAEMRQGARRGGDREQPGEEDGNRGRR